MQNAKNFEKIGKLPYGEVGRLTMSGSVVSVGTLQEREGDCLYILTEDNPEPVFMSLMEAQLLAHALLTACNNLKEQR